MGFNTVDVVIVGLAAFLAIKGLINGFTKELLNFIAIIGGIVVASNYNTTVIELLNKENIIPTISDSYAKIAGFLIIFIAIWLVTRVIASILSNSDSHGIVSRFLGYLISFARYLFIFSLIIFGINRSDHPFKEKVSSFQEKSKIFEPMSEIGSKLLNIDLKATAESENNTTSSNEVNIKVDETNLTQKLSVQLQEHNSSNE